MKEVFTLFAVSLSVKVQEWREGLVKTLCLSPISWASTLASFVRTSLAVKLEVM